VDHFAAQAPRIGQRIDPARSRNKFVVQLADDAAFLHFAHGIQRHQAIGIFLNKAGIVTAVLDLVFVAAQIISSCDAVRTPASRCRALDSIRVTLGHEPAIGNEHHPRLRKIFDR
jgi:hypothetical protein